MIKAVLKGAWVRIRYSLTYLVNSIFILIGALGESLPHVGPALQNYIGTNTEAVVAGIIVVNLLLREKTKTPVGSKTGLGQ